jgi:NTE family protein
MADGDRRRMINLALQGGGAHGAFTWGVLDRLLEDERIGIDGISGTSAGAVNAAILAQGFLKGRAAGARAELDQFWRKVSTIGLFSPIHRGWYERAMGSWNLDDSPASMVLDQVSHLVSPYQTNPLNLSPLRDLLAGLLDWKALNAPDQIKLFITATNVQTGKPRIFDRQDLTLDALMASTSLPQIFQAVIIDGEPYWDGGYMGNPSIWPLVYNCQSSDVVLVQINPLTRMGVPRKTAEINNRLNEITFNAALMAEMRAIFFAARLVEGDAHGPEIDRLRKMHMHMIEAEAAMEALGVASKLNTDLDFLLFLRDLGRATAHSWLERNFDDLGRKSSLDIRKIFG